jgi:flagellar assembly factor FliW
MTTATMMTSTSVDGSDLYLDAGLPGFPGAHRFRLSPWGDTDGPFSLLVCLDAQELAFVIVRPEPFFPDYQPEIDRATADRLGLVRAADAIVYVIVTLGPTPLDATVNLLGPLVINSRNQLGAQVVLDGDSSDVRTPLISRPAAG